MPAVRIVVDSTADIPPDVRAMHDIHVVPVLLHRNGETLRDDIDISRDEYYRWLAEHDTLPTTSAPPVGMFEQVFRELTRDGGAVLSLSVAAGLSATYGAAVQAARLVPEARIVCVDSHSIAMPIAYLALAAARCLAQGATLDEAVALVETLRDRTVAYVSLQTLRYLERGGRISRTRALLGTLLDVKPVLEVRDSQVLPVERVRTWRRVPPRLLELAQARGAYQELSVVYTTGRDEAETLADACAAAGLLERDRIRTVQIGAVLGTHMGPGALGITGLLAGGSDPTPSRRE